MVSPRSPRAVPLAKATKERARLLAAQSDLAELKAATLRREIGPRRRGSRRMVIDLAHGSAGMLAVSSRAAQRLPHLTPHDVAEIDAEVREALVEVGTSNGEAR